MIYTVTFNPSLDYVMFLPTLNVGGVSRAEREVIFPGGKGINVAVVLERLGHACTALGFKAGYTGETILSMLRGHLPRVDFISLSQGQNRINVKIKSTQESDVNGRGPEVPAPYIENLLHKLNQLQPNDVLVLSGAVSAGVSSDVYARIVAQLQPRGVLCVVDAVGPLLKAALPFRPFLIKPNAAELAHLFGVTISNEEELLQYARKAQEQGAQSRMGEHGRQSVERVARQEHRR